MILKYAGKIALLIGLQTATLIGVILLFFLDFLVDLLVSKKDNNEFNFKKNTIIWVLKSFFLISLIGIIYSFTFQLPLIFSAIFNSVLSIIILDGLINITKSLAKITNDSTFIEITKIIKEKLKSGKETKNSADNSTNNTTN
jgi:hypothetical protein